MERLLLNPAPNRFLHSAEAGRIPEITTRFGGRPAEVPQSFYDFTAADAANPLTHPHMGPFTFTAVQSGPWSSIFTWNASVIPGENDVVNIGSNTVTYDIQSDVPIKDIHVGGAGRLRWDTSKPTSMLVDTIMNHGTHVMGEAGDIICDNPITGQPMADIAFWQSEAPGASSRLGLNTMGPVRIQGCPKADRLFSSRDLLAGRTYIRLERLKGANWRKGDKIVVVQTDNPENSMTDPQYEGPTQFYGPYKGSMGIRTQTLGFCQSHDEVFTIVGIVGDIVMLDGVLQYDHVVTTKRLRNGMVRTRYPVVANLTRSIRFRATDTSTLQHRPHTMFMHHDDIDVRYSEYFKVGRTDTNPSLAAPDGSLIRATNGGEVITDSDNVRGRYAGHIHVTGAYFGRRQVIFKGNTSWSPPDEPPIPGWAFTHHGSRVAMENNVTYNSRGAGMVSELGNEIGQWLNNTSIWNRGDGYPVSWGSRAELSQNHNGHAGVGFESQARQILQQGNISSSSNMHWLFMQQNVAQSTRVPDMYSLRVFDPLTSGAGTGSDDPEFSKDDDSYGIENAQIPDFFDNACYGGGDGFFVAHRNLTDRTDMTPLIFRGFDCIRTKRPFHLVNYSFIYSFYDSFWQGPGYGTACTLGSVSWKFVFMNMHISDFDLGFEQEGLGFNYDGWWIDIDFENVAVEFEDFRGDFDITDWQAANPGKTWPQHSDYFNLMGEWITDEEQSIPGVRWVGILRKWRSLNSVTDFPQPYPAAPRGLGGYEPSPGTPIPYWFIDPSSDLNLGTDGKVSITGIVRDPIGSSRFPDWFSSETYGPEKTFDGQYLARTNGLPPDRVIKRNGCFFDGADWKVPAWFKSQNRLTGDILQKRVDLLIHPSTDAGLLAANVIDPNFMQEFPLRPEAIGLTARPLVLSTTPPAITSAATVAADEGVVLKHLLKAAEIHPKWAITGGADAARFEINTTGGVATLRWAGNGVKDYEAPNDANLDNVYEVQVTCTNSFTYSSSQTVSVTVQNNVDTVVAPFTDSFTRANEDLEASPNWFRIGGMPGQAAVVSNAVTIIAKDAGPAAYVGPDTGSNDHYSQGRTSNPNLIYLAVSITDANNFIGVNRTETGGVCNVYSVVAGVFTLIGTYSSAANNSTIRLAIDGGAVSFYINGVLKGIVTPASPPPATTRAGFITRTAGSSFDNYESDSL